MNLEFEKDDKLEIKVYLNVDGARSPFTYIEMIKQLIVVKKLESPLISGSFTDAEINSINSMCDYISKEFSEQPG